MSLIISDEFLARAHVTEADLKLEMAILLFQQGKITLSTASTATRNSECKIQNAKPDHASISSFLKGGVTYATQY